MLFTPLFTLIGVVLCLCLFVGPLEMDGPQFRVAARRTSNVQKQHHDSRLSRDQYWLQAKHEDIPNDVGYSSVETSKCGPPIVIFLASKFIISKN